MNRLIEISRYIKGLIVSALLALWLIPAESRAQINCTLDLGGDTVYCGNPIQFIAGAGYQTYNWNTGSTAASITATTPGIYAVTVTSVGSSVVQNGNFNQGNSGFYCAYVYNPVSVWNEGTYAVTNNSTLVHSNFHGFDHTNPPSGNFLVCNGSGVAGTIIWQQTVNVIPGIQYIFSTWITTLVASNPALIQFYINGAPFGPIFPAPAIATQWIQFYTTWLSGTSTTATISIVNQNTILSGNDFGIDDIYFAPVLPCVDTVIVNAPNIVPTLTPTDVNCFGESTGQVDLSIVGGYTPFTFQWNNSQTTQNLNAIPAGNYTVTITDAALCTVVENVSIDEPNLPLTLYYTSGDVNCAGEQSGFIDLTVSGGVPPYSYNWGFSTQQDVQNLSGGNYVVTVTDAATCVRQLTVAIDEPPPLLLNLNSNSVTCHGASDGFVSAQVSGGVADYTFLWNQGQANYAITNLNAGTYSVTVMDNHGCTDSASATLTEPAAIQLYTSPDKTICLSESAEILANAIGGTTPYQYFWVPGGLATSSITVAPEQSTEYCVYIKDHNQCQSNERCVSIFVNPPLELRLSLSEDTICKGDTIIIRSEVSGGNGGPYVIEHAGAGSILPQQPYVPEFTQNIVIYAYDGCGTPTVMGTVPIVIQELPHVSFRSDNIEGCPPLAIQFTNNMPGTNEFYEWSFDDASFFDHSYELNPMYVFQNPGIYDVSLKVTDQVGCTNSFTHEGLIHVWNKPLSVFSVSQTSASMGDPMIEFYNQSVDGYNYLWGFGDGDSTNLLNPLPHFYTAPGEYLASLIVESVYGCTDTSYTRVEITGYPSLYLPNSINPFSYLQQNRIFKPIGTLDGVVDYQMLIFDRWGEIIFKSDNSDIGWNGYLGSGKVAPQGTYPYMIEFKGQDGTPVTKSGNVNLIY